MKNVGKIDRIIRLVLGILLISLAVGLQIATGHLWWIGIIGLILLGTAVFSFCPLYLPFKIHTK